MYTINPGIASFEGIQLAQFLKTLQCDRSIDARDDAETWGSKSILSDCLSVSVCVCFRGDLVEVEIRRKSILDCMRGTPDMNERMI